jgi:hypothetical protein
MIEAQDKNAKKTSGHLGFTPGIELQSACALLENWNEKRGGK